MTGTRKIMQHARRKNFPWICGVLVVWYCTMLQLPNTERSHYRLSSDGSINGARTSRLCCPRKPLELHAVPLAQGAAAATYLERIHNMMTTGAPASGPACGRKGQEAAQAAKHCTERLQVQTRDGVDASDDQRAIVTFFRRRVALQRSRQATPTIQVFAEVLSSLLDRASGCNSATRAAYSCGSIH